MWCKSQRTHKVGGWHYIRQLFLPFPLNYASRERNSHTVQALFQTLKPWVTISMRGSATSSPVSMPVWDMRICLTSRLLFLFCVLPLRRLKCALHMWAAAWWKANKGRSHCSRQHSMWLHKASSKKQISKCSLPKVSTETFTQGFLVALC